MAPTEPGNALSRPASTRFAADACSRPRARRQGRWRSADALRRRTVTFVGLVTMSYTAERFCDCATSASMSFFDASASILKRHLDVVVAVAHVAVDAEDALDVHRAFERRLRPSAAGCRGSARPRRRRRSGSSARPTSTYSTGVAPVILGREDLRMIGVERELGLVLLFLRRARRSSATVDLAVRAVLPFAGRPPCELGCLGAPFSASRASSRASHVHAVVDARTSHTCSFRSAG